MKILKIDITEELTGLTLVRTIDNPIVFDCPVDSRRLINKIINTDEFVVDIVKFKFCDEFNQITTTEFCVSVNGKNQDIEVEFNKETVLANLNFE